MGIIARGRVTHSYPHSWRSKAPIIFRNTPQWFASVDREVGDGQDEMGKTIRERALNSIDQLVKWWPQTGRNRLYSMIESASGLGSVTPACLGCAADLFHQERHAAH